MSVWTLNPELSCDAADRNVVRISRNSSLTGLILRRIQRIQEYSLTWTQLNATLFREAGCWLSRGQGSKNTDPHLWQEAALKCVSFQLRFTPVWCNVCWPNTIREISWTVSTEEGDSAVFIIKPPLSELSRSHFGQDGTRPLVMEPLRSKSWIWKDIHSYGYIIVIIIVITVAFEFTSCIRLRLNCSKSWLCLVVFNYWCPRAITCKYDLLDRQRPLCVKTQYKTIWGCFS